MNYPYTCLYNEQKSGPDAPKFLLFRAKAKNISAWSAIQRHTADSQQGPQRLSKPAKVTDVQQFLVRDARNTIPTALLVSLNIDVGSINANLDTHPEVVDIVIEYDGNPDRKPAMVVDGQHRLLGAMKYDPEIYLNIIAMINATDDEIAFQFLVINNKASRVPTNHLRCLALKCSDAELGERLRQIRMSISPHLDFVGLVDTEVASPFLGIIDWPNNQAEDQPPKGFVAPSAIESSIAYIKQKRIFELEDDGILLGFFLAIWLKVKEKWSQHFRQGTHLMEKVPIICLTQFLVDDIAHRYDNDMLDVTNYEDVQNIVDQITNTINSRFWDVAWTARGLDTTAGRNILLESLTQMRRNDNAGRFWYENVPIVDLQSV